MTITRDKGGRRGSNGYGVGDEDGDDNDIKDDGNDSDEDDEDNNDDTRLPLPLLPYSPGHKHHQNAKVRRFFSNSIRNEDGLLSMPPAPRPAR